MVPVVLFLQNMFFDVPAVAGHATAARYHRLLREGTGRHPRPLADVMVPVRIRPGLGTADIMHDRPTGRSPDPATCTPDRSPTKRAGSDLLRIQAVQQDGERQPREGRFQLPRQAVEGFELGILLAFLRGVRRILTKLGSCTKTAV